MFMSQISTPLLTLYTPSTNLASFMLGSMKGGSLSSGTISGLSLCLGG